MSLQLLFFVFLCVRFFQILSILLLLQKLTRLYQVFLLNSLHCLYTRFIMIEQIIKGFKNNLQESPYRSLFLIGIFYCFFWGIFNLKNIIYSSPDVKDEWLLPIIPVLLYPLVVYLFSAKSIKEYCIFPLSLFFLPAAYFTFIPYWFDYLSLSQSLTIAIAYFVLFLLFMYFGKTKYIVITLLGGNLVSVYLLCNYLLQ